MSEAPAVLDASALLALLQGEQGADAVAGLLPGVAISAINLSEVAAKLAEYGMPASAVRTTLDGLSLEVHSFDRAAAYAAGELRPATRKAGLSLGGRACLALAAQLGVAAITADRAWAALNAAPARITVIR